VRPVFLALTLPLAAACGSGTAASTSRTLTSTITVGLETLLSIESPVAVVLSGNRGRSEIFATFHATVTASTSTRSRNAAEALTIDVSRPSEDRIVLSIAPPREAGLSGKLELVAPPHLDLEVGSNGTVEIAGMEGEITVGTVSHVKVTGAKRDVTVQTRGGNILVESTTPQGTRTDLATGGGDIELTLFERPSVDLEATFSSGAGEMLIAHPAFPQPMGATQGRYHATVNGGLAIVRLLTQTGRRIVIRTPPR
jgi:hypothetical protein